MNRLLLLAPRIATNRLWARAGEVPSFHIAPARTQNARDLITGSVLGTYNSASPAWAVGPDGVLLQPVANAPVIEYDPTILQCLGARTWGVATNGHIYSEDATQWVIPNGITLTANQETAPNGTLTADRYLETAVNGLHVQDGPYFDFVSGTQYTYSVFVKPIGGRNFQIGLSSLLISPSSRFSRFNLSAGVAQGADSGITPVVIPYPNGWFRCAATFTAAATVRVRTGYFISDSFYGISYTGDTSKGVFIWGAQINPGPLAPYVPTAATAASSTADVWDITSLTAGINNLKTLYFRGRTSASGTRGIASLNDNTANNRLELSTSGTTAKATAVTSSSTVADLSGGTIAANTTFRLAARFDTDSYAISINGGAVVTDTSGARALVDRLFIGRDQAGNYQNGYLEEMAGWTQACTDAQVAALAAS